MASVRHGRTGIDEVSTVPNREVKGEVKSEECREDESKALCTLYLRCIYAVVTL